MRILDTRADFGHLCNELEFVTALEIGTHQGVFADEFLARFAGTLHCVDPWSSAVDQYGDPFQPSFVPHVTDPEVNYAIAQAAMRKYPGRVRLWRETSQEHAFQRDDESLDFIYIDGMHSLTAVASDLVTWWPKLRPGGVLAGHDYAPLDPMLVGVAVAVNAFCCSNGLDLHLTKEKLPSWYVRKPLS